MSETEHKCARCGATIAGQVLQGICPRCLMVLNVSAATEELGTGGTQPVRPPPSLDEVSKLFPQMEIIEPLGRGGMGVVYKARQPRLDRFVALKVLLRRQADGSAETWFAERFAREARALARLNHPAIVAVYDYGEAGGYPYLIMEYVDGLTLRQLLQHGKLEPEQALAIVPKICEALQFAHEQGVVHRDIKPENILIDKQGRVKIADFGIAKILAPGSKEALLTGGKDVIGTPHYMAPEQVEQPGKVDHRADIFSLGVVFYEMLTGELPLGKFQPPSGKVHVDVKLDEIVLHALEKEPARRYQHASEVRSDVETYASGNRQSPNSADTEADVAQATLAGGRLGELSLPGRVDSPRQSAVGAEPALEAQLPKRIPPSLIALSVLLLLHGFYGLLETLVQKGSGFTIYPNTFCLAFAVGLLFLRQWSRLLALAWVWISYALYAFLLIMLFKAQVSPRGSPLRMQFLGHEIQDPGFALFAGIMFTTGALLVIWTHWLLTRPDIKRLFAGSGKQAGAGRNRWAIGGTVALLIVAVLAWLAAPRKSDYTLTGTVTSLVNGKPVSAKVTAYGPMSRQWQTTTDRQGRYSLALPHDADLLYWEANVRHGQELRIQADADGHVSASVMMSQTRDEGSNKRRYDFQLPPALPTSR